MAAVQKTASKTAADESEYMNVKEGTLTKEEIESQDTLVARLMVLSGMRVFVLGFFSPAVWPHPESDRQRQRRMPCCPGKLAVGF